MPAGAIFYILRANLADFGDSGVFNLSIYNERLNLGLAPDYRPITNSVKKKAGLCYRFI